MIAIVAPKGGVGKSQLTLNLSVFLALRLRAAGKTVCIVDANFQQADAGKYIGHYSPTITDLVRDPSGISPERIRDYLVHPQRYAVSVLLGPSVIDDADPTYINGALYSEVIDSLRQLYDYVFIDTPVAEKYHNLFNEFVIPKADRLVVATIPSFTTLINVDNWLRSITAPRNAGGAGYDPARIGVILNQAAPGIDCTEDDVRRELANWRFLGSVPATDQWRRAENNFELVADKNYAELNEAFARILYVVTGERVLLEGLAQHEQQGPGLFKQLARAFRRGHDG